MKADTLIFVGAVAVGWVAAVWRNSRTVGPRRIDHPVAWAVGGVIVVAAAAVIFDLVPFSQQKYVLIAAVATFVIVMASRWPRVAKEFRAPMVVFCSALTLLALAPFIPGDAGLVVGCIGLLAVLVGGRFATHRKRRSAG